MNSKNRTASPRVLLQQFLSQQTELPLADGTCQKPPRNSPHLTLPQTHGQSRVKLFPSHLLKRSWISPLFSTSTATAQVRVAITSTTETTVASFVHPNSFSSLPHLFFTCNQNGLLEYRFDHVTPLVKFLMWILISLRIRSWFISRLCTNWSLPASVASSNYSAWQWLKRCGSSVYIHMETYPCCAVKF